MLDPDDVAAQIASAIMTNKREINLPRLMNAGTKLYQLFPALVEKLAGRVFMKNKHGTACVRRLLVCLQAVFYKDIHLLKEGEMADVDKSRNFA